MTERYLGYQGDPNDKQAVFDFVAAHLLAQGRAATTNSKLLCRLRGAGGTMCAVGCLIPDADYHSSMEDGVATMWRNNHFPNPEVRDVIRGLQRVHDMIAPEKWPVYLRSIAINEGLAV